MRTHYAFLPLSKHNDVIGTKPSSNIEPTMTMIDFEKDTRYITRTLLTMWETNQKVRGERDMSKTGIVICVTLLFLFTLSTAVYAARPVVTIATYSQPRYLIMQEQLLPKWQAKYPDIEIRVVNFPDFWNKLLVLIGTGDAPDIVDTAGTYLFGHVVRGGVVNLESIVMNDPDLNPRNFWPGPWNEVRWPQPAGSGVYGVPYDSVASILWYNKTLFDNAGVGYPSPAWTWDDLRANAKKVARDTNGDGTNDIWGFTASTPWPPKIGHYALIGFAFTLLLKNAAWNLTGAILSMLP